MVYCKETIVFKVPERVIFQGRGSNFFQGVGSKC